MSSKSQKRTGGSGSIQRPVSLIIPCRADYVGLCRLLAGVVGARESLPAEDIADLKLVVTEACNCFLGTADDPMLAGGADCADPIPETLLVELTVTPDRWEITVDCLR